MTRFEASFPGPSGMPYFGFIGVSRRLGKVLPVKVLSLDGLTVPRNASRSLDHPNRYRDSSSILAPILSKHEDLGDLRSARSSEQNMSPGFEIMSGQLLCTQGMDSAQIRADSVILGRCQERKPEMAPLFKEIAMF